MRDLAETGEVGSPLRRSSILGCPEINIHIHTELWKSKNQGFGFESTLEELRKAFETHKGEPFETNLRTFERMLESMFNSMNNAFKQIEFNPLFDPHTLGHSADLIRPFLAHFDAIFTLNQDCLLELKYNVQGLHRLSEGRWRDMYLPGVQPVIMSGKPQYLLMTMFDEPQALRETYGFKTAAWNAAPVAAKVIERTAPILGVERRAMPQSAPLPM